MARGNPTLCRALRPIMPLLNAEDLRRHSRLAWASLAALLATAGGLALAGAHHAALGTLAGLLGCLALILPPRERMRALPARISALPRHIDAAPVLATLLSCPGYGLGWFHGANPYDEAVHLLNGMLAGAVLHAWLALDGKPHTRRDLTWTATSAGLALSIAWELFEAATGLIGDALDTSTDILLTTGGVILGALSRRRVSARRRGRLPPHPHRLPAPPGSAGTRPRRWWRAPRDPSAASAPAAPPPASPAPHPSPPRCHPNPAD